MKRMLVTVLICFSLILAGCSGNPDSASPSADNQNQPSEAKTEKVLIDDDCIKATYLEMFEADGVNGVFYIKILVENKTDKTLWVHLSDTSVNGMETMAMSGVPMTIQPGNKSQNPFIISYTNLNISQLSEVETISFKFAVDDNETMHNIETSDIVTIP